LRWNQLERIFLRCKSDHFDLNPPGRPSSRVVRSPRACAFVCSVPFRRNLARNGRAHEFSDSCTFSHVGSEQNRYFAKRRRFPQRVVKGRRAPRIPPISHVTRTGLASKARLHSKSAGLRNVYEI